MPKITYLLGAGASANALPTIAQSITSEGLSDALNTFTKNWTLNGHNSDLQVGSLTTDELTKNCKEFKTPDLYAKYLLETGDYQNYKRLKVLLSLFFKAIQEPDLTINKTEGNFDFRALQFLITLTNERKLPTNVKLISWNYDRQIELAAERLLLDHTRGFASWPNIPHKTYDKEYFLLHLNGIAGYTYSPKHLCDGLNDKYILDIKGEPLLSFAWEDEKDHTMDSFLKNRLNKMINMVRDTEILVVIGYSFPFFNRSIDKVFMETLRDKLQKIYYQDPVLDGRFLRDQFNLQHLQVTHIKEKDQYFIPYEL